MIRQTLRRWAAGAALSLLAATAAGPVAALSLPWSHKTEKPEGPPRPVVTEIVTALPAESRAFPGAIVARTQAQLAFQALGTMTERAVDLGDRVTRGQILARLDPDDLQSNVRAAEAAAEAAQVQLDTARTTEKRTRELARRNVASQAQLEQVERALIAAEAGARQAQSQLARARDATGFAEIAAPFDGVISNVLKEPGSVVSAGDPVLVLSSTDGFDAVIDLPEPLLIGLAPGTPFVVTPEHAPQVRAKAKVDRIEPLADAATRTRRVHLEIEPGTAFRIGALVRAVRADQEGTILTLPMQALIRDARGHASVWVVARTSDGATVQRQTVTTGLSYLDRVHIPSGLTAGQEVVVRGVNALTQGQAVGRAMTP